MDKEKRPPGRPRQHSRISSSVYIDTELLFKMRELNRSELINSLLKKHFDAEGEEKKGTVQ